MDNKKSWPRRGYFKALPGFFQYFFQGSSGGSVLSRVLFQPQAESLPGAPKIVQPRSRLWDDIHSGRFWCIIFQGSSGVLLGFFWGQPDQNPENDSPKDPLGSRQRSFFVWCVCLFLCLLLCLLCCVCVCFVVDCFFVLCWCCVVFVSFFVFLFFFKYYIYIYIYISFYIYIYIYYFVFCCVVLFVFLNIYIYIYICVVCCFVCFVVVFFKCIFNYIIIIIIIILFFVMLC